MRRPPGKWIRQLDAATPVHDAARLALSERLSPLPRLLRRAAGGKPGSGSNIRRVHQLRVATRRAGAAIRMFEDVLDPKAVRRWKKWLRRVRRAAGRVRDLDIAIVRLSESAAKARGGEARAIVECVEALSAARLRSFPRIGKLADRLTADRLAGATDGLLASIDAGRVAENTVAGLARRVLRAELDETRAAAAGDLEADIERVHALRIAIKRLRYAMELFGNCFGDEFRGPLYAELSTLQEQLGGLNDAAGLVLYTRRGLTLRGRPSKPKRASAGRSADGGPRLLARAERRLAREHRGFLAHWRRFDAEGFFKRLEAAVRPTFAQPSMLEIKPDRAGRPGAALNGHASNGLAPRSGRRRIGAIDVGTNSLRLIVAEVDQDGAYRVLDDEKEVTRLGRGLHAAGRLDPAAIDHSVAAIARMKSIADGYGVDQLRVVATAAAREAANADDLAAAVRDATGLEIEVIAAEQEAMLAYRSAARAFDLSSTVSAVVDIGGGSTEVVLAIGGRTAHARVQEAIAQAGGEAPAAASPAPARSARAGMIERLFTIPLGAVRLTERFGGPEAASGERYREMRRFVKRVVAQHIRSVPAAPQLVVGTGGTFTSLAAMALQRERGSTGSPLFSGLVQGHEVGRAEVRHLLEYLRKLPVKDRARVPGLSADRADIIVAGLTIIDVVLKRLEVNRARIHEGGIRDGLLLSMIGEPAAADALAAAADPMHSVRRLARACAYEEPHSLHVARLALAIFDQLRAQLPQWPPLAADPDRARQILEAAAVLHDIGYLINYSAHHKHSYHLIVHAELPGWTSREVQLIANIARYHRSAAPSRKHEAFDHLARDDRRLVRELGGILRIADGLDRTHVQAVTDVALSIRGDGVFLTVAAADEPGVDLWGASRKSGLFERAFGLKPHFEWREGRLGSRLETQGWAEADNPGRVFAQTGGEAMRVL